MSQSAYKQLHSTETAFLKVRIDIHLNIDNGKVTALTMLDLSAAFDTIDHNILIRRLSRWYGKVTALTLLDLSAAFDTIDHNILISRLSRWYGIYETAGFLHTSSIDGEQLK